MHKSSKFHRITPERNVAECVTKTGKKKKTDKIHTTEREFESLNAPAVSGSLQTGDHQHMGIPRGHLGSGAYIELRMRKW